MSETIRFQTTSKTEKTLFESENINLKINFFWDSHGKMIPWELDGKKSMSRKNASVKIVEVKQTYDITGDSVFTSWVVYVNGSFVSGDIARYSTTQNGTMLNIKSVVGSG